MLKKVLIHCLPRIRRACNNALKAILQARVVWGLIVPMLRSRILDKMIFIFVGIVLFHCWIVSPALAQNNKVGIHILETVEVDKASELVNSNGGDWGYVTIVLRDDDFDKNKWQKFMDDCRKLHLIPIVRIATHMENSFWAKPIASDLNKWAEFLDSLNWPIKKQIVVLFNEPNHAKEWGGEINPSEYVEIVDIMVNLFRSKNPDFWVMMAGFDQAADGRNWTMREEVFLQKMVESMPDIFNKFDGWVSHSYPRNFAGLPSGVGRASVMGYDWEIELIKSFQPKVDRHLDEIGLTLVDNIYITETGWGYGSEENKAEYIMEALNIWQADESIKAVTPFVLNYPAYPFEHFSWLKKDGTLKQYQRVMGVSKVKGEPEQIEKYEVVSLELPDILPTNYEVKGKVKIKNTGQWIMGEREEFRIQSSEFRIQEDKTIGSRGSLRIQHRRLEKLLYPGEEVELEFAVKTGTQSAEHKLVLGNKTHTLYVFKPFDLKNEKVSLWRQIVARVKLWLSKE